MSTAVQHDSDDRTAGSTELRYNIRRMGRVANRVILGGDDPRTDWAAEVGLPTVGETSFRADGAQAQVGKADHPLEGAVDVCVPLESVRDEQGGEAVK